MSYELEERAIHERLKTQWNNRTAIKFGDSEFTQPTGDARQYLAIFILNSVARRVDLGDVPLVRNLGFIIVQVFGAQKAGTRTLKALADLVASIFREQTLTLANSAGVITTQQPVVTEQPSTFGWAQVNVDIPFRRDSRF